MDLLAACLAAGFQRSPVTVIDATYREKVLV
jgi:hypothetical protein